MQLTRLVFVLIAILAGSLAPAQQSVNTASNAPGLLHGVVVNNTYTNSFLGFSYPIPEGWEVNSDAVIPQHPGEGKEVGQGGAILLVLDRNKHLFYRNRILLSVIDANSLTVDTQGFVSKMVNAEVARGGMEVLRTPYPQDFAGKTFYREDYQQTSLVFTGYKAWIATRFRDYFLGWTLVASSLAELNEAVSSLGRISFQEDRPGSNHPVNVVFGKIPAHPGVDGGDSVVGTLVSQSHGEGPLRVRLSEKVSQGLLLNKIQPEYPENARQRRIQGLVIFQAVVDIYGNVKEVELVSGPALLTSTAMSAAMQWKYKRCLLDGKPVEVETQVTVAFSLAGN